jgi:hypothetical protein
MSNDEYGDYYPQVDPSLWAMQQFIMPDAGGYPTQGYMPAPGMPMPQMPGPMGMQPQMDPLMYQQVMSLLQPSLTSKGKLEPYDIDYQGKIRNAQQDVYGSFDDPIWTLLSGLGSTTPEAFDPITERKPLELRAEQELAIQAQMGGVEGEIAKLIMNGMSPLAAAASIRAAIENPDQVAGGMSEEERNTWRSQIPSTMTQKPGGFGQEEAPDWAALGKMAADMAKPVIAERAQLMQPGIEYDEMGRAYTTSEKPSALQEFLQKTGIPDPRDEYGAEYYAKQNPTETMRMMERISNSESRLKDARKALQSFVGEEATRKRNLEQDQRQLDRYSGQMQDYGARMAPTGQAAATGLRDYMSQMSAASGRGDVPNADAAAGQRALLNQILEGGVRNTGQEGGVPQAPPGGGMPEMSSGVRTGLGALSPVLAAAGADPLSMISPLARPAASAAKAIGGMFGWGGGDEVPDAFSTGMAPGLGGSLNQSMAALEHPNRPRLSTYSEPFKENLVEGQMRGLSNLINSKFGGSRRPGPEDNPKAQIGSRRSRGEDVKRRRQEAGAASLQLAMALAPQLALARSGRTPINDVFQQKMQPFYASGAAGQPGMPWQYPRLPGR